MELVEVCELELQMLCGRSVCLPTYLLHLPTAASLSSSLHAGEVVPLPFNTIFEWGHNRLVYRDCAVVNLQSIDDPQCALCKHTRFHARVLLSSSVRGERRHDHSANWYLCTRHMGDTGEVLNSTLQALSIWIDRYECVHIVGCGISAAYYVNLIHVSTQEPTFILFIKNPLKPR